jgi:hypothetical protein
MEEWQERQKLQVCIHKYKAYLLVGNTLQVVGLVSPCEDICHYNFE